MLIEFAKSKLPRAISAIQEKDDVISKLVYWGFIDTQDMCRILDIPINKSLTLLT